MPPCLEPKLDVLPAAQKEIWTGLAPVAHLNFVLYGGTAIALHLGHRESLDFDFFSSESLDKDQIRARFQFVRGSVILQDAPETLVVLAERPSGSVKISFFGGIRFAWSTIRCGPAMALVASLEDLMATKLKTTLNRAEAKDYRDIAAMISAGVSLAAGLSAFKKMFDGEPAQILRALGYFGDGDLNMLSVADRNILCNARDQMGKLPEVHLKPGSLTGH
jgi:hypothetical protein